MAAAEIVDMRYDGARHRVRSGQLPAFMGRNACTFGIVAASMYRSHSLRLSAGEAYAKAGAVIEARTVEQFA